MPKATNRIQAIARSTFTRFQKLAGLGIEGISGGKRFAGTEERSKHGQTSMYGLPIGKGK
jgi:hypothetical protein